MTMATLIEQLREFADIAEAGGKQHWAETMRAAATELLAQTERADYAWRNANTIEKARQEEMAKRDALQAEVSARNTTIISLLEILRQWEPDWSSGEDRRTIVLAMYQVGILTDPTAITSKEATHG